MSKIDNTSDIRKTLLRNGYLPLANRDKRCFLTGWPTVFPTEEMIDRSWSRMHRDKATGIRIDWPLGFIDNDVSIEVINREIIERWADHLPDIFDDQDVPLLERGTTASCKVAYFVRVAEKFGRLATREFRHEDGSIHRVEIWGGGSPRQAGAFGAHGEHSRYVWTADSPLDVPLQSLPELTKAQCVELLGIAEEVMQEMGLQMVERLADDSDAETVYDITEDMQFESADSVYTLAELKAALAQYPDGLRLTGSWHDKTSTNKDSPRCIARLTGDDLLITDFGEDGRKHREASKAQPIDDTAIQAAFEKLGDAVQEPPKEKDGAAAVAAKLCRQFVYCRTMKTAVIAINDPNDQSTQSAFVNDMAKFGETRTGPRGGEIFINPAALWIKSAERISVAGLQMRPDMPRPLFEEDGNLWLNTYRPPIHDTTGGDSRMLWLLIDQIAPEQDERDWLVKHLAHKFRFPHIPGPAVIMLAQDQFGTGRGTFMALLEKLFGRYVTQLPAHMFTGSSYQSQYTEWLADSLIVCVEEMIELKGNSKWSAKHDVYERLKELIEPRCKRRKIVRKGVKSTEEMVSCSLYAFLNNLDDIPIHDRDRRCFVMRNGMPRDAAFWVAVNKALDDPACVAEFARELLQADLTGYSPYDPPPVTEAKEAMAELAKPDMQIGLESVLAALQGRGELFSMVHIVNGMRAVKVTDGLQYPEQWESYIGRIVGKQYFRIGVRNGANWHPMFDGRRWATYAWSRESAVKWTKADPQFVSRELHKVGPLKMTYGSGWSGGSPFGAQDNQNPMGGDNADDSDDK